MTTPKAKPDSHIINILKDTRDHHPNFTLFLGAGASVQSNVKHANKMISVWRNKYYEIYGKKQEKAEFLRKQFWYNDSSEYSNLFELLYDQPSQRREYIESCLKDANPSWGYIYLVNLIRKNVFNTVFTTNFDDLLNEACYLFSSDVRPIVSAHDSSIRSMRITSKRPKIIKLHGDFLFDNIKNTILELESLEENMRDKFRQFASEFGMITVGYSGNDRSVMDTLNTLLRSENNFPHGVYWCVIDESNISQNVLNLTRYPKFHIVKISGFDEFFAEMHEELKLDLQPEMSDPFSVLTSRLNKLIEDVNIPKPNKTHPIIKNHIAKLGQKVSKMFSDISHSDTDEETTAVTQSPAPFRLLAQVEYREGNHEKARSLTLRQLAQIPDILTIDLAFDILETDWNQSFYKEIFSVLSANKNIIAEDPDSSLSWTVNLIQAKKYNFANEIADLGFKCSEINSESTFSFNYYSINKAQIKRHQKQKLDEQEVTFLKNLTKNSGDTIGKIAAYIVLDEFDSAYEHLSKLDIDEIRIFMEWPISKLLPGKYIAKILARMKDKIEESFHESFKKIDTLIETKLNESGNGEPELKTNKD